MCTALLLTVSRSARGVGGLPSPTLDADSHPRCRPPCEQKDRSKNISLPQTSFAGGSDSGGKLFTMQNHVQLPEQKNLGQSSKFSLWSAILYC